MKMMAGILGKVEAKAGCYLWGGIRLVSYDHITSLRKFVVSQATRVEYKVFSQSGFFHQD
jgi:hypothetical protein